MPRHYVDNAMNRSLGRVGMAHGTAVHSSSGGSSYASSSRTYVDNSMNRSLGRVGMAHGTAVHSSSGGSSYASSSRTYVDNSMNRSLGRVGQPLGSAVHSRSSMSNDTSSSRTYADNPMNRSLGRVGQPLGSAVHSKSGQSSYSSPSTYVDNALNRRLGRVGLERGTATYSKSENSISNAPRTYADNAYNRRLGRANQPLGSAIVSKSGASSVSKVGTAVAKTYVDNALNRRLGRVGKPLGSMPVSKLKCDPKVFDLNLNVNIFPCQNKDMEEMCGGLPDNILEEVENLMNLKQARCDAKQIKQINSSDANKNKQIQLKSEQIIPYDDLELGSKIGGGGFGDVHTAFWKGQQVAVKKLRVQRVTQARKKQFEDEVRGISELDHPNIVKFYGACVVTPNLALVMEFLPDGSLYDNLYYSEVQQFDEKTKNQLVCDSFSALQYIHSKNMVHRDIKSKNILLFDEKTRCKLADFGLALKDETESDASTKDFGFAGTEKYCPKELIDGERLTIEELKRVDVYSLALTTVELLTEKEPFSGKKIHQIRKAISAGEIPTMDECGISTDKKRLLNTALSKNAIERPSAAGFLKTFNQIIDGAN